MHLFALRIQSTPAPTRIDDRRRRRPNDQDHVGVSGGLTASPPGTSARAYGRIYAAARAHDRNPRRRLAASPPLHGVGRSGQRPAARHVKRGRRRRAWMTLSRSLTLTGCSCAGEFQQTDVLVQTGGATAGTDGAAVSGAMSASCCRSCRRERCVGPAQMITAIAAQHHTPASSHDCRIESAPLNMGEKKLPDMVLFAACITMMISTLPPTLLKTALKTITAPKINTMSDQWTCPATISGMCQPVMIMPRMRLARSAD